MKQSLEKIRFGETISDFPSYGRYEADESDIFTLDTLERLNSCF